MGEGEEGRVGEGKELVQEMHERGGTLRLLGGAAIYLHCPNSAPVGPHRPIGDLDAVIRSGDRKTLFAALEARGYVEERRFNALHGDRRLIFHGPHGKLDVFIGRFEMCHTLQLEERLPLDSPTLPATDLLLTKLQVVEFGEKDLLDASLLLREHALAAGEGDHIDVSYLARLISDDWGLLRTVVRTMAKLRHHAPELAPKLDQLEQTFTQAPKTRRFRLRARVGDRVRWYELPDDVDG
jgi:hypothetical protein